LLLCSRYDRHAACPERASLAAVLTASAISTTGTRVSAVALPWFVLVTTGSATRTGLVAFCEMAVRRGQGVQRPAAGPPRAARVISWTTDAASAVAAGLVPVLHVPDRSVVLPGQGVHAAE
jgi:hypothetical protein